MNIDTVQVMVVYYSIHAANTGNMTYPAIFFPDCSFHHSMLIGARDRCAPHRH